MTENSPADVVVLFGPPAVGKTAVGRELAKLTGFKLYHGHMTMDVLSEFFAFGSPSFMRLHRLVTMQLLEEAAEQRMSMIVTTGWHFGNHTDLAATMALSEPFLNRGGNAHYIELWAPIEVRIERNLTKERLLSKKVDWSTEDYLRSLDARWGRDSAARLQLELPHLALDTSDMTAAETAAAIADHIGNENGPQTRHSKPGTRP